MADLHGGPFDSHHLLKKTSSGNSFHKIVQCSQNRNSYQHGVREEYFPNQLLEADQTYENIHKILIEQWLKMSMFFRKVGL
jgi:hypothetical protein